MPPTAEIQESNERFRDAWNELARRSPRGEVLERPELFIASANVAWPMMNAAFLRAPVETEEELARSLGAATRYFQGKGRSWMMVVCEDWLGPQVRRKAEAVMSAHGLQQTLVATGMVAERLAPPVRPLPPIELRRVEGARERQHIADVNALCYDIPIDVGREAFDVEGFFGGDCQGYVGLQDGAPATTAAVIRTRAVAYLAMVATLPAYRKRSYAEAVMRHALAEAHKAWSIERTVLHATPAGLPVYLRMGYRIVSRFFFYMGTPTSA